MKKYKCMNIGSNCNLANTGKPFEIAEGEELKCPDCKCEMLVEVKDPKIKLILIGIAAVVVLAGAAFGIWKLVGRGPEIDKVKLDKRVVTLVLGETQRDVIKASVVDKDGKEITDAKVTYKWTSQDEKVVTVTQGGEVTAMKKGNTSITVKIEGDTKNLCDTCKVEVKEANSIEPLPSDVLATSLSVSNTKVSVKVGKTASIGLRVKPENITEGISAESSNPDVATVEDNVIKANKKGKATITIETEKSGKTATIDVTVTKEQDTPKPTPKPWSNYAIFDGKTMTFKKSHVIPGTNKVANPGDIVTGKWVDGEVNFVRWYHDGISEPLTHK